MNITIIGAGNVGQALATAWRKAGHTVTVGVRNPGDPKVADLTQQGIKVTDVGTAARGADVILLAVPWGAVEPTIKALGVLDGKILVDATNPLTPSLDLALGFTDSAGETVARLAKGARVVKAFNTTGAGNMANTAYPGGKLMMAVAGDDADAKKTVMGLASDIGFAPADVGPISMSRQLEPLAVLWIKLAYAQQQGPNFGFAVLRR
jgi:8-hydroxy-5-deazaflavin:NADPH oxidoreductase